MPSQAAAGIDDRNLTGANGQSCFWFSNGCAIGCKACDGSTRGPIPSFTCTNETCTYTGKPIQFGPKAPICTKAEGSMPATMCDPKHRTVNTQAKCGSPDDFFYYARGARPATPRLSTPVAPRAV